MKIQATYKSAIVNGKILEFAQITLKERMKKQQGDIEGQIAALMQKNETHKEWFDAIVQSKPQFPNGVMTYQDIVEKMGNNARSLEDFLNEKIKEELERKMAEEINKQVETKIEEEKINIQRDADEIKNIQNKLAAKNDENYRLEERNRELSIEINNKDKDHAAALEAIKQKNLTSQQQEIVKEQNKNLKLQQEITELKTQLFDKKQLEIRIAEADRQNETLNKDLTLKNSYTKIISDQEETIKQLQTELSTINKNVKTTLHDELKKAMSEIEKASTSTQREHESQLAAEKANCQQKMMELTKTIVLLKMNLDLKEQQTINSKSTFVPSLTNVSQDRTDPRPKKLLLGGAKNKSKIFMKGGAKHYFAYDDDETVVVFNAEKAHIGQYPKPTSFDDYVVHCTEKEISEYVNRTQDLRAEIESLKKKLESSKNSASTSTTPLCTFVNKMTHGSGASADANAKLITELIYIKTQISLNANKFLFEKIANLTNQKIINVLTKANTDLKAANAAANTDLKAANADLKAANAANATNAANAAKSISAAGTNAANAAKSISAAGTNAANATNAAVIAAGTAKAILAANANVFKSKYGKVMFSKHK